MYTEFFNRADFYNLHRTLFVQNITFHSNETGTNLPLKCRGLWISPIIGFGYIHLHYPAIVCHHTWSQLALVPLTLRQGFFPLLKSYLQDRYFVTTYYNETSSRFPMLSGVPQRQHSGSIIIHAIYRRSPNIQQNTTQHICRWYRHLHYPSGSCNSLSQSPS